jgi:uncharacterized protein (TIRG00374 family)
MNTLRTDRAKWLRLGTAGLLLLVIFHIIFCNEAQVHLAAVGGDWHALTPWEQRQFAWARGPVELWRTLRQLNPWSLLLALGWCGLPIWVGGMRWREALRVQGLEISAREILRVSFIAHFFNAFLLGSTGGDVVKAWYASRFGADRAAEAALTVVVDRLLGTLYLLLFAVCMLPLAWEVSGPDGPRVLVMEYRRYLAVVLLLVGMLFLSFTAVVIGFYSGWLQEKTWTWRLIQRLPRGASVARALAACRLFGRDPIFMLKALAYSLIVNLGVVGTFLALANGLQLEVPTAVLWFVVPAVVCIAALPVTPSGLGVRENLMVALLALPVFPGVKPAEALSLALLAYMTNLAWSALGGCVYLIAPNRSVTEQISTST